MDEMAVEALAGLVGAGALWYCCCRSGGSSTQLAASNTPRNKSFFFIKAHGNTPKCLALVKETLAAAKIQIDAQGTISAKEIDEGGMIDKHYGTLAERAMNVEPLDLPVWAAKAEAFKKTTGMTPEAAAKSGKLLNLRQAMALLPNATPVEIEAQWRAGDALKLAPGTYVGHTPSACFLLLSCSVSRQCQLIADIVRVLKLVRLRNFLRPACGLSTGSTAPCGRSSPVQS
jgi:hypothetical protein